MLAIFLFCVLPIALLSVGCIGASIIQIGMNSIDDKELNERLEKEFKEGLKD